MTDKTKESIDTSYTKNITCPFCGNINRDSWEVDFGPGLEGDMDIECGSCGKTFFASRIVTVTYSTIRKATTVEVKEEYEKDRKDKY